MAYQVTDSVLMEDVQLIFKNFTGREGKYNREGDRNFGVIPNQEQAEEMREIGWPIKELRPREDDDPEEPPKLWMPVSINWKGRPPRVVIVSSRGRTNLSEKRVEMVDYADIRMVDLIVNPYNWDVNGAKGVKAYCKSLFVTIHEDPLDLKYAHLPEQGQGALPAPSQGDYIEGSGDEVLELEAGEIT